MNRFMIFTEGIGKKACCQMNQMQNRETRVLDYLKKHKSISPLEAINDLGVTRLSAAIYKLKHKYNVSIRTEAETSKNRFGEKVRYARYYLEGSEDG